MRLDCVQDGGSLVQLPSTQPQQQGLHQHGWQADNQQGGQQQIQDTVQTVAEIHVAGLEHPGIGGTDMILTQLRW